MYTRRIFPAGVVIRWTGRHILLFLFLPMIPVFLFDVLELKWLHAPWLPLGVLGTAVAFIIGFKNNASYDRLWEARKIWGGIVNASRSWTIMVKDFISNDYVMADLPAFSGPADLNSFDLITHKPSSQTIHAEKSDDLVQLEALYQQVRDYRAGKNKTISRTKVLEQLIEKHPNDWLLPVELYELAHIGQETLLCKSILQHLETIKQNRPEVVRLID